ncbi:MAG: MATE family efflux transporter, partial [Firmicutes bacterium]|nr:MATE family efflux transporter [Bacillota bacterium]
VFQAVGDSRHPLYYLVISSLLNIALDMLFIMVLGIGIAGAAIATVIAQLVAALLAFTKLLRVDGPHRISIKEIKIDVSMLKDELALGIPSGIQNSVISLANVIVQANINAFDSLAMAGCGSYSKLEGFAFLPIVSFAMALTTFVSQNIGARQYDRARSGARFGILSGVIGAEIIGAIMFIFAPFFISFFSDDPEVIAFGVKQAHVECLFYCLLSYNHTMAGVLRGAGKTKVPMAVMLICWCLIRITYITIAVRLVPVITTIFIAYPLTWSLSAILFTSYYLKVKVLRDPRENVKI